MNSDWADEVITPARGNAGSWMPYAMSADKERKHIQSLEGLRASKPTLSGLRILPGGVFIAGVSEADQAQHQRIRNHAKKAKVLGSGFSSGI